MTASQNAYEYANLNVGVTLLAETLATEYACMNVRTGQPMPLLLGARQSAVYVNEQIDLYATGCGTTPGRYASVVQVQSPDGTWSSVPIDAWVENAASVNAYGPLRTISPSTSTVDPMHQRITITAPEWASPPHLPIRVVTHEGLSYTDAYRYGFEYAVVNITT